MAKQENSQSRLESVIAISTSADFWAGWISGASGIMVGNSLDRRKVFLQAQSSSQPLPVKHQSPPPSTSPSSSSSGITSPASSFLARYTRVKSFLAGAAAPSLGSGALNAILFVTYNRTEEALNQALQPAPSPDFVTPDSYTPFSTTGSNLWTTWFAGAAGGLAIWPISTPTELVKCKVQHASISGLRPVIHPYSSSQSSPATTPLSSWHVAKSILRIEGVRGLYRGGVVTALRDSIGYGFYFWSFELGNSVMDSFLRQKSGHAASSVVAGGTYSDGNRAIWGVFSVQEAVKVVLCGGLAGVATWASVFPLDLIKTRVQIQVMSSLCGTVPQHKGAVQIAKELYIIEGPRAFFRGLMICSVRAFFVNAFQWPIYKGVLFWLSQSHSNRRELSCTLD
ncbi:mitochondrial carrier [Xylaria venustula]|nr:mitochondrial carrier [Xylaria venustula]